MKYINSLVIAAVLLSSMPYCVLSQKPIRDEGKFIEYKNEFWDSIQTSIKNFNTKEVPKKKSFKMDFSKYNLPKSKDEFTYYWHNEPISQGSTGTCWAFSTTSFLESEVNRIYGKKIDISELYTVYWEYVEKARRFIQERGKSEFGEGSQANAVTRIWEKYGCVPSEEYTGLKPGQTHHDHSAMFTEMNNYLQGLKINNAWNEELAISTIKSILEHYMGAPPETITVAGEKLTPKEYFQKYINLKLSDYVDILSLKELDYFKKGVYDVPDNWWKNGDYNNVPIEDFIFYLKKAVNSGYTVFIGGDVSESGIDSHSEVAMVPSYDIPSEYIDDNARQLRFSNNSTTDDHGIHIVGYKEGDDGKYWFLIKDSGSGSFNGTNKGYYFYHEDYIKLKMMNFMVHRSAVEELLRKMTIN